MTNSAPAQDFKSLVLIGCGKMGSALLERWSAQYSKAQFTAIEPHALPDFLTALSNVEHIQDIASAGDALSTADIIMLAVKPQVMDDICREAAKAVNADALILSIAAGRTIGSIAKHFSAAQPLIRVMPNTPAAIGKGMSVACAGAHATQQHKNWAQDLLETAGLCEWLDSEDLMDAVTALSGSGPAYVFHVIEMLTKSGEALGFSPAMAMTLARQTVIGAAALAEASPDITAAKLRGNVTSPGGTTEAALKVLMDGRAQKILDETLKAAEMRGRGLNENP